MKRRRYIKKWWLTVPRVAIREPGIYEIKMKVSQLSIERTGGLPGKEPSPRSGFPSFEERKAQYLKEDPSLGEIKRGSVDVEEDND